MNLEIFSCAGGMAEGFRRAGLGFDHAFDWSTDACDSYEANHGHRPIQIDACVLVEVIRAGWTPGLVELLVADPPCTPWSRAGKRQGLADDRDMLRVTAELIRLVRPLAYLIGNVPGLQDSSNAGAVAEVIGGLRSAGYCTGDYAQLDAADYGVPQHRIRPFWFGHRVGPCIQWPAPSHADPRDLGDMLPGFDERRPWVTCREALRHLPLEELGRPVRLRWRKETDHRASAPGEPAKTLATNVNSDADEPARTVTASDGMGAKRAMLVRERRQGMRTGTIDVPGAVVTSQIARVGAGAGHVLEWPWDRPATTLCGDPRLAPTGHHGPSFLSEANAIVLSERAATILQGFPETWRFCGKSKRARWAQLGMAMPPPLAEAVARSVLQQMRAA